MTYDGFIVYMLNSEVNEITLDDISMEEFIVEFGKVDDIISLSLNLHLKENS